MKTKLYRLSGLLLISLQSSLPLHAAGDMTQQQAITVKVKLGNTDNALRFYPDHLRFETGKLYKLVITNPSPQKHYFIATGLSHAVFTRKVQLLDKTHNTIVEVKGIINEIEVYPNGISEWWFVPVKTLSSTTMHCSISGHAKAGMTGRITIK